MNDPTRIVARFTCAVMFSIGCVIFMLTGCASATPKDDKSAVPRFENRLACTDAGDKKVVLSWWRWFGFFFEIDQRDNDCDKRAAPAEPPASDVRGPGLALKPIR